MEDTALVLEFIAESLEHLETIDQKLLTLESDPNNTQLIDEIFRSIHTIKGVSGMLSFEDITNLAHRMETLLNRFRQGEDQATSDSVDVLLQGCDVLKALIEEVNSRVDAQVSLEIAKGDERVTNLLGNLDNFIQGRTISSSTQDGWAPRVQLDVKLAEGIEQLESDAKKAFDAIENVDDAAKEKADAFLVTSQDLSRFCENRGWKELVPPIDDIIEMADGLAQDPGNSMMVLPFRDLFQGSLEQLKTDAESVATQPQKPSTPRQKETPTKVPESGEPKPVSKTMRVDQSMLDVFMNLVGELVVAKNSLVHGLSRVDTSLPFVRELKKTAQGLSRLSEEMQRSMMDMRMIPVETVFQKFPRMARDISQKLGKKFNLVLEGKETKIDKGIAELIGDPLVHLVRNSMDHGVEMPDERIAAGKSETGTITLSATNEGGLMVIEIIDDGKGIDPDVIFKKAVEKGLAQPEDREHLSKKEIISFIMAAGFSTAEQLTDISGRGVGMDVVNTNITKLGGKIDVDSEVGKGSTFRLELPLTTAIVDSLLFRGGDQTFAIPVMSVLESITLPAEKVDSMLQEMMIEIRGQTVAVKQVDELLLLEKRKKGEEITIIVLQVGMHRFGIAVDKLLRLEEVVVKPLPEFLSDLPGVSGASTLGDGTLVLILDPPQLIELGAGV